MKDKKKIEILVRFTEKGSDEIKYSFIENTNYETALKKFLMVKGGKDNITILSIQDWDRREKRFTIDKPITLEDKNGVVYKIMNE